MTDELEQVLLLTGKQSTRNDAGMDIEGTTILLTGASSGIGAALSVVLTERDAHVIIVARRSERLKLVAQQCRDVGREPTIFAVDLGDLAAAGQLASKLSAEFATIDCIVNNAAIPRRVPFGRLTMAEVEETMRVNFLSPAQLTLDLLPAMLHRQRGLIVNVSSMGGRIPIANESAYNASKFALAGWSEAMRLDLDGTGVDVKLILPGPIDTEIWDQPGNDPAIFDIEKVSARDCAMGIADAMQDNGFEYYIPPLFPGGMDAKAMAVAKYQSCDDYLTAMARFSQR